jgi:hypothetical protein
MSRQPQHVSNPWAPQRQGKASNINRLHATHNSTYLWDPPTRCSLRLIAAISGPAKHTSQTQDRVKPPKGACRALRMHCIRCGDVASKKSRPMDTHDATHRYLAPKTAETYPHTPSRPRHTSANANRVTMFFFHTLLLINALYRSSANVPFLARVPDTASGSTDR